MMWRRKNHLL